MIWRVYIYTKSKQTAYQCYFMGFKPLYDYHYYQNRNNCFSQVVQDSYLTEFRDNYRNVKLLFVHVSVCDSKYSGSCQTVRISSTCRLSPSSVTSISHTLLNTISIVNCIGQICVQRMCLCIYYARKLNTLVPMDKQIKSVTGGGKSLSLYIYVYTLRLCDSVEIHLLQACTTSVTRSYQHLLPSVTEIHSTEKQGFPRGMIMNQIYFKFTPFLRSYLDRQKVSSV